MAPRVGRARTAPGVPEKKIAIILTCRPSGHQGVASLARALPRPFSRFPPPLVKRQMPPVPSAGTWVPWVELQDRHILVARICDDAYL